MKSTILFLSVLLMVSALPTLLAGCGSRQQVSPRVSPQQVSDAVFSRYAQKYPDMGKSVKQGYLTKDAAYSLRYIAPQRQIMYQFTDAVEAKRVEIYARHIPEPEKHRLLIEYIRQNQMIYINAANAAGRRARQEEQALGHSPFAQ